MRAEGGIHIITDVQERNKLVTKIIETTPSKDLTPRYLEVLADYLIFLKKPSGYNKDSSILTPNRMVTITKRETSFEGVVSKFENGEDGIYQIMSDLGKNQFLTYKDTITEADIAEIPGLKELKESIERVEEAFKDATGRRKFLLKQQLISMRQDQYVLKNSYRTRMVRGGKLVKVAAKATLYDDIYFDENNNPQNAGFINLFNYKHVSALLCNYSDLKEEAWGDFTHDLWYQMTDLDDLVERALKDQPLLFDIVVFKIDGLTNIDIQKKLEEKHGHTYSPEYISSLWRNKIPKLISAQAVEDYLLWYYSQPENKTKNSWKKCSKCKQTLPAHNFFFSKNSTAKSGWCSQCKKCRNAKTKMK